MNKKKTAAYSLILVLAIIAIVFYYTNSSSPFPRDLYQVNFPLSRTSMGTVNTYLPIHTALSPELAAYYMGLFGFDLNLISETEYHFVAEGPIGIMTIDKYDSRIFFEASPQEASVATPSIESHEALKIAEEFIRGNFLFLNYEEAEVYYTDNLFDIRFIGRIGNIKSIAFNTRVVVDGSGNVIKLEYYNTTFEKYRPARIKTMEQAFYELPIDFPPQTRIVLDTASLVYIYENSLVQPAYIFKGQLWDGEKSYIFESSVKSAIFS